MATNVFSGARAVFKVDDQKIAFASNVDVSEEIMYEPVDVLDNIEVMEHVPVGYRVTISCGIFRTVKSTIWDNSSLMKTPANVATGNGVKQGLSGSVRDMGIYPKVGHILTSGVMTVSLYDRLSTHLITLQDVKAQTYNFSVTARGIVAQNLTFVAIRAREEGDDTVT
jgi:hypothetical protein